MVLVVCHDTSEVVRQSLCHSPEWGIRDRVGFEITHDDLFCFPLAKVPVRIGEYIDKALVVDQKGETLNGVTEHAHVPAVKRRLGELYRESEGVLFQHLAI